MSSSLLVSFFLLKCYSQHNKIYIEIFSFNLSDLQMFLMFTALILQCSILHSITIFFYILYINPFEKTINIEEEGSKIIAITFIVVKIFWCLITFIHLKSLSKFIFYTLYRLLINLFSFLFFIYIDNSAKKIWIII